MRIFVLSSVYDKQSYSVFVFVFQADLSEGDGPAVSYLGLQTPCCHSSTALHQPGSHQGTRSHFQLSTESYSEVFVAVLSLKYSITYLFVFLSTICTCLVSGEVITGRDVRFSAVLSGGRVRLFFEALPA